MVRQQICPDGSTTPMRAGFAAVGCIAILSLSACGGSSSTVPTPGTLAAPSYSVGGTVTGLAGSTVELENNGGDALSIGANGTFAFVTPLIPGDSYDVSVSAQPGSPRQICAVSNGAGIVGVSNVTNVVISCANDNNGVDSLGGAVTGLLGNGLVLRTNTGDTVMVSANGPFTFPTALPRGLPYAVTVWSPPINPYQDCAILNGTGTTGGSDITNVSVYCKTNVATPHTIGGTLSGISGNGSITLLDNGRDDLVITADGAFQFATPIPSGSVYDVTSLASGGPQSKTCTFSNAAGIVGAADVTNVLIQCKANSLVSVTTTGLVGAGLVLQDNGGDNLAITGDGTATFATAVATGSPYDVTVVAQPTAPTQQCVAANNAGIITAGVPAIASVTCSIRNFTLGGSTSGLVGTGLVLQDNGASTLPVAANGAFTFPTAIASGTPYTVAVATQPTGPSQTCAVTNGGGTIGGANVTSVQVNCTTNSYSVGGVVSGLAGVGLVLQDNAGNPLAVGANGSFTFPAPVASGGAYAVTVLTQPNGPAQSCAVANGSGVVGAANVGNVVVTCTTNAYTVGGTVAGLNGSGLILQDNGGNDLTVVSNGPFVFPAPVTSGDTYSVTVLSQPAALSQTCTVSAGAGTVTNTNVVNVAVTCTTNQYTVGGVVSGLGGNGNGGTIAGLALQLNGGAAAPIAANGPFTLTPALASGSAYTVTVQSAPTGYLCVVGAGTGAVTSANVTGVNVTCGLIGAHLYASNAGDNTISTFGVDQNTGALLPLPGSPVATGTQQPVSLAAGGCQNLLAVVTGTILFVANEGSNSLSLYGANFAAGTLTSAGTPTPLGTGTAPTFVDVVGGACLVVAVDGGTNQVSAFLQNSFALTSASGSPFSTGTHPVAAANATFTDNAGNSITSEYVANQGDGTVSQFKIDPTTGSFSPVGAGAVAAGSSPASVASVGLYIDGDSTSTALPFVYVANQASNTISGYRVDTTSGALQPLLQADGVTPLVAATGNAPAASASFPFLASDGVTVTEYFYVANRTDNTISIYTINTTPPQLPGSGPALGALVSAGLAPVPTGAAPSALSVYTFLDANSVEQAYLFVANSLGNTISAYAINTTNSAIAQGALTPVPGSPFATGTQPTSLALTRVQ